MLKRCIVIMLAFVLACVPMVGCSSGGQDQSGGSSTESEEPVPITGDQVADGTYDITVDTDSSMVNVVYCKLDVKAGQMTATMALHGQGFSRIWQGNYEDADKLKKGEWGDYAVDDDGWSTFTCPVEALDKEIEFSLFGHRRDRWYPHMLIFESKEMPEGSITR